MRGPGWRARLWRKSAPYALPRRRRAPDVTRRHVRRARRTGDVCPREKAAAYVLVLGTVLVLEREVQHRRPRRRPSRNRWWQPTSRTARAERTKQGHVADVELDCDWHHRVGREVRFGGHPWQGDRKGASKKCPQPPRVRGRTQHTSFHQALPVSAQRQRFSGARQERYSVTAPNRASAGTDCWAAPSPAQTLCAIVDL